MGYWIGMSVNWGDLRLLEDNSFWNQQDLQNPKMRGFSWNCEGERELQGKKRLCFSPGVSSVCDPGQPSLCRKSSSCLQRMGLHRSPRAEALFANRRVSDTCLSLDSSVLLQAAFFRSFYGRVISHRICVPQLLYQVICWWVFRLLPHSGYCK